MLNLLIRKDRYKIRREYLFRYANIVLILIFILSLSVLVLLYSLLSFSNTEFSVYEKQNQELESSELVQSKKEYVSLLSAAENKTEVFSKNKNYPTYYIKIVEDSLVSGVSISSFESKFDSVDEKTEEKIISMNVKGISLRRDNLLSFTKELEQSDLISEVSVPFSNFVKEENLAFTIDIYFNEDYEK